MAKYADIPADLRLEILEQIKRGTHTSASDKASAINNFLAIDRTHRNLLELKAVRDLRDSAITARNTEVANRIAQERAVEEFYNQWYVDSDGHLHERDNVYQYDEWSDHRASDDSSVYKDNGRQALAQDDMDLDAAISEYEHDRSGAHLNADDQVFDESHQWSDRVESEAKSLSRDDGRRALAQDAMDLDAAISEHEPDRSGGRLNVDDPAFDESHQQSDRGQPNRIAAHRIEASLPDDSGYEADSEGAADTVGRGLKTRARIREGR